jgi:hypothetical protein
VKSFSVSLASDSSIFVYGKSGMNNDKITALYLLIQDVQVDVPRPRVEHCRGSQYFDLVDDVVGLLEKGKRRQNG